MPKKLLFLIILISAILINQKTISQTVDSTTFEINSRLSFYSFERNGEFLLHIPAGLSSVSLSIKIKIDGEVIASWRGKPRMNILRVPFTFNLAPSIYKTDAEITVTARAGITYMATTRLIVLSYKPNEVKTDRLNGGLIVNKRQFFPFGFYCYSPVFPTLPEEEVVKGFNMMSPYQKIMPEKLNERKAYMDRCAELGMKVNYNLLSVSGGGGTGSTIDGLSDEEKKNRLVTEIKTFRDHPALLGWYIADEPNGYNISPEILEEIYRIVKENDPWHPVSIVFMWPYLSSKQYSNSLDIVMADPYPVPDSPVNLVGEVASQLKEEYTGKRPVWMATQSFGGGEIWNREPTLQEIRSMTWQSIIKGATGIQYFVRQGLNYFPKSAATWGECGRMAVEVAELTPWLLSDEQTLEVESASKNILTTSRLHNNQLIVMAVNRENEPAGVSLSIGGINSGKAIVLFENRSVNVTGGLITDHLAPYASEVYLINLKSESPPLLTSDSNLLKDPGFEDLSSPGIPSACYARPGGDRGATFFLDSREHHEGNHSLKIITPVEDKGVTLRFFPFKVKAGSSYTISMWTKSDPEQRFFVATNKENDRLYKKTETTQYVEIEVGSFSHARFAPDSLWRRYVTFVTIPNDTLSSFKTNLVLKMPGQGVAWFDEIKIYEEKR